MLLMATLMERSQDLDRPFLVGRGMSVTLRDVVDRQSDHIGDVARGEIVALVGDFDAVSISDLFALIDRGAIVMPLSPLTRGDHEYFFESAGVTRVVENGVVSHRHAAEPSPLIAELRRRGNPGLILFSTGTTGRPKAILHDLSLFLERFATPRPAFRTLSFLLFDHIGGINTLLHTIFNSGTVIALRERSVEEVLRTCRDFDVEVLPATPTFLRLVVLAGVAKNEFGGSLKVVTYGTERMDQPTLAAVTELLPDVDFRQTFGMSELGILRVKSKARDSLLMKVGGEGVSTRVVDDVLHIWSPTRMMGYLNAPSPFDEEGWYDTGDIVVEDGDYIQVVGRKNNVINVGGLKFMASEIEDVAIRAQGVELVAVTSKSNPITGQHVEILVQPDGTGEFSVDEFRDFLRANLATHMVPRKITLGAVPVGHRLKRI